MRFVAAVFTKILKAQHPQKSPQWLDLLRFKIVECLHFRRVVQFATLQAFGSFTKSPTHTKNQALSFILAQLSQLEGFQGGKPFRISEGYPKVFTTEKGVGDLF